MKRVARRANRHGRARPGHPRRPTAARFPILVGALSDEHWGACEPNRVDGRDKSRDKPGQTENEMEISERGAAGRAARNCFPVSCFQGFAMRKISPPARPTADDPSPRAGGGIKAGLQANGKLFQIRRVSVQAFPNKALAVLRYFKGLQGLQTQRVGFQIFSPRPPFSTIFPPPPRRIPRRLPRGFERWVSVAEGNAHVYWVFRLTRIFEPSMHFDY
jgi:hypothetical protein